MRTISRDEVNALPVRRYEGPVRLVESHAQLEHAVAELRRETVLGFDTETRPAFRPGERHPPALVQLAGAQAVYLLPLKRMDFSFVLREILGSKSVLKAGVGLADDLRELKTLFAFHEENTLDLGLAAKRAGIGQSGVRNLAAMFLGFRIPKGTKTSNWAAARLSPQQVSYAATDAWACRELYLCFSRAGMLSPGTPASL
jgi:ribonuclease D